MEFKKEIASQKQRNQSLDNQLKAHSGLGSEEIAALKQENAKLKEVSAQA